MSYLRTSGAGARLRWAGLFGLIAALSLCLMPGIADAKKKGKKKDQVKVVSYNLYLGSSLDKAVAAATEGEGVPGAAGAAARLKAFDHLANQVGFILNDVNANDFNIRAQTIAKQIKKQKVDLAGLQEAALWRLEVPTDGGGPPRGTLAIVPLIDYIDTLVNELNKGAKSKKACGKAAKKRKAQGKKPKPCYRGYRLVGVQQEADVEQPGDFDNNPGPNGIGGEGPTFTETGVVPQLNGTPPCASVANAQETNPGGDDTGVFLGDPGPPNTTLLDPAGGFSGQPVPFDWNGDSSSNSRNGGAAQLNCGPDTLAGVFGVTAPPYNYAPQFPSPVGGDCPDTNPIGGQSAGPEDKSDTTSSCVFHGIDGDVRLTMRDVILARNGAGVKTSNVTGANFSPANTLQVPVLSGASTLSFARGWVSADVSVRGKRFHFVNTHLESEPVGSIREDQAAELVAPGGPATALPTVLVGDLNSDPTGAAGDSPDAYNRVVNAGFKPLSGPSPTYGHGVPSGLLNNSADNVFFERIDYILTNSPSITLGSTTVLNQFANGLWASDHGGVLSRLNVPGGKKKK